MRMQRGQSVVEVLVAMGIFSLVATALVTLSLSGLDGLTKGGEHTQAEALAQEGIEAVRSIRDGAWNENTFSQSGVEISSSEWVYSGEGTTETIGQYIRSISFSDVCRDGSDDIVGCPGNYTDVQSKQVTVDVSWTTQMGVTNSVQKIAYLSNWDSREWTQTDWSGGSGQSIWADATQYDSDDGNVVVSGVGEVSLVSGDSQDDGFSLAGGSSFNWPFSTGSNYTFDAADIEVVSGQAQLKSQGGGASGDTINDQFTSGSGSWTFNTWDVGGGEVTPTGAWQSSGGNPGGYVNIDIPSNARNDQVGGYWRQPINITENNATVTCSFGWRIPQWVASSGVDDYKLYVFLDSAAGAPTIGNQIWASGTQSGTTSWSGQQNVDCSSAAVTAGTYYFKIGVWLDAKNKNTGPITAGFDNAKVHWEGGGGSFSTDEPDVYPNSSLSVNGLTSWDSFTETATKNGGEIFYQLTDDNGSTWQYWNGLSWATVVGATDYNISTVVDANIGDFDIGAEQIKFRAFLESDGTQLVQLDNVQVGYSTPASVWSFSTWDVDGGEVTPTGVIQSSGGNPDGYGEITVPAARGDEVGGYWEQPFNVNTDSPTLVTIDFDYQVIDYNDSPKVTDIRVYVDSASGAPATQVGSSISVSNEGVWTGATQTDATTVVATAGTYYLKVAFWVETGGGPVDIGPWTVGFDNVDVILNDAEFPATGTVTSSAFDMGDSSPVQAIEWEDVIPVCSPTCTVQMQVQSAPDSGGSPGTWSATWSGPDGDDGDETDFYTIGDGELIHADHNGDQWVRYRVTLGSDGDDTPVVNQMELNYK